MINVFQPSVSHRELLAVEEVFQSNWLGKGKITDRFEEEWARHLGVPRENVLSISCCTEALFLSMDLLGITAGDEVILPSISFVGAANAVAQAGAKPVFCDVDPSTLNATSYTIQKKISKRTKAIIALHYGGLPCEIREIAQLARDHDLYLVEDSAAAPDSLYDKQFCGTYGDIGVWSFDAMKIMTTGDGGMMYVKNPKMAEDARKMTFLGLSKTSGLTSTDYRWWEFEVSSASSRHEMNDIQSAIGLVQLSRLKEFTGRRGFLREIYDERLRKISWLRVPPETPSGSTTSNYMYWIRVPADLRDELAHYLRANGVYTTFRYYPLHKVGFYNSTAEHLPGAEQAARETLNLPLHQGLAEAEVMMICSLIERFKS